ncbi:MAG: LptE family protein [Deltaproteobacteria bacterium]|nr:LptE family protein [Deltaproteobacteria bacterium]
MIRLILALIVCSLSACGYQFQGSGSVLPEDIKYVYIPRVENTTTETRLSSLLTEALRERFERYGVLLTVEDLAEADAVLNAEVLNVNRQIKSVTSGTDTALEYETTVVLDAELRRNTGALLWKNPKLQVAKGFGVSSSVVVTSSSDFSTGGIDSGTLSALDSLEISRGQEQEALIDIAEEIAKQVYEEAVAPDF